MKFWRQAELISSTAPSHDALIKVGAALCYCVRLLKNYTIRKFSSSACLRGVHCLFTGGACAAVAKRSVISCQFKICIMISAFRSNLSGRWRDLIEPNRFYHICSQRRELLGIHEKENWEFCIRTADTFLLLMGWASQARKMRLQCQK